LHPAAKLVRDVAIAREYDFEQGEHIATEEEVTDAFISPSRYASGQLISWGVPTDKMFEIPFGVDTERFRPISRERKGAPNEGGAKPVRFAFAGAVSGRKGVPTLIRAWQRLSLDNAELHLYGTVKPEVEPLLSGTPNVHAHGFVQLADELPRNDVFVFPSTREGSAKAIYEALASGLPVITTPNSGSVVRDEKEGFIVPPENEAALARAMAHLARNAELRLAMGARARNRALEFTWERYAVSVWETYDKVLSPVSSQAGRSSQRRRER
jgi:glycosyltransferase involved in cell wall biosynthesis